VAKIEQALLLSEWDVEMIEGDLYAHGLLTAKS
jgi:hypothetical protein